MNYPFDPDLYTKISVNNLYGYFAYQGIPKTIFLEKGIVLKSNQAENTSTYSLYFFDGPQKC